MDHVILSDVPVETESGVQIQKIFGECGYIPFGEANLAHFCLTANCSTAPQTAAAELIVYIMEANNASISYGRSSNDLSGNDVLKNDDVIFIEPGTWFCLRAGDSGTLRYVSFTTISETLDAPSKEDAFGTPCIKHITRDDAPVQMKTGRKTWRVCGAAANALIHSDRMQGAYACFSPQYGAMESHMHEMEYMVVIGAKNASVCFGSSPDNLAHRHDIYAGEFLRPHEGEWHRFDFSAEDGYVDFLNLFSVPLAHVMNESDVKNT